MKSSVGDAYSVFLDAGMPVRYLCYNIADAAASSVLFAVAALWVSTYIPNRFVTMAAPLVVYFVASRFTTGPHFSLYLMAVVIVEGGGYDMGSPILSLLFKLGIVAFLCLLIGVGALRQIKRRVLHD